MSYARFAAMIVTSIVAMYALTYSTVFRSEHIFFSETRLYMALVMGSVMAVIMLGYMLHMYKNKKINFAIFAGSALVFLGALWLTRSQETVEDVSWMKAMIPHHSIAILTSERANISDPRVQKLATAIIETQRKEIAEMKRLIQELEENQ